MWYWHVLSGFMYFMATIFMIFSYEQWRATKKGNTLTWFALLLFIGAVFVNALH